MSLKKTICCTGRVKHLEVIMMMITIMTQDPAYGNRFVIEYDPKNDDFEFTHYKEEN